MEITLNPAGTPVLEKPPMANVSDIVIAVHNVGKMYRLYERPQDRLKEQLFWRFGKHYGREFWALHDVTFEVRRGETVGIIGRNGSGKSTLLQIIAGTLAPTVGNVKVIGRVAALLELGSGFNPEFTGRENVLLNGSILGISPEEIAERYDEIVAFADIDEFINQPVKLYSSGMIMRLAFAVQVIMPKDVFIVDEALAVGDEAFQRKCYMQLEKFKNEGGTVLLVSHSAQTIVRQCERGLFLHSGELLLDGPSKSVTDIYQRFSLSLPHEQQAVLTSLREKQSFSPGSLLHVESQYSRECQGADLKPFNRPKAVYDSNLPKTSELSYGNGAAEILNYGMYDELGNQVNVLVVGSSYTWRYMAKFKKTAYRINFGMMLKTVDGLDVAGVNNEFEGNLVDKIEQGQIVEASFTLQMNVTPGVYYLNSGISGDLVDEASERGYLHRRIDICAIRVVSPDTRVIYGFAYLSPQVEVRLVPVPAMEG